MSGSSKYGPLLVVIFVGIVLQVLLIPLGCRNTPYEAAVSFTKAYLKLDPSMADYLCEDSKMVDDIDTVTQYIHDAASEASARGFGKGYVKSALYKVITHTEYASDSEATVTIKAKRRTAINPVFAWVTYIFHIGGTYAFEETIEVVKEDGNWKVCGSPLALHQGV